MEQSKLAWTLFSSALGTYKGPGVNHEKQNYTGNLQIEAAVPGKTLTVKSSATGDKGETYHNEYSWIGFDLSGNLTLYVVSTNHPAVTPHLFHHIEEKEGAKNIVF